MKGIKHLRKTLVLLIACVCCISGEKAKASTGTTQSDFSGQEVENYYKGDNSQFVYYSSQKSTEKTDTVTVSIDFLASGQCGESLYWSLGQDGTMTISGQGAMWDYRNDADYFDYHENPWRTYKNKITNVIFESGIEYIGADAFSDCSNLAKVTFSDTITSIGVFSFMNCPNLENFILPDSLQYLGQQAFDSCTKLTSVVIPDSVVFLDAGIFSNATSLTYVYIGGSKDAGGYVYSNCIFRNCSSLEKIYVSEDNIALTSIDGVLYSKDKSTLVQYPCGKKDSSYTLPVTTKSIMQFSVECANYLQQVTLPNGLLEIGTQNFTNCSKLKSLTIPSSVTEIGTAVGAGCVGMEYITNKSDVEWNIENWMSLCWVDSQDKVITTLKQGTAYLRKCVDWIDTIGDTTIQIGESLTLELSYGSSWGEVVPSVSDLVFTSSNSNIVSVDSTGKIKALKQGSAIITVVSRYGTAKQQCKVYVQKEDLSSATISEVSDKIYTGSAITPSVKVYYQGKLLKKGTDYTITYSNNKSPGTATINVTGKGDYTGTKKKTFKITKAAQKVTTSASSYTKTVGAKSFSLNAKTTGNGKLTYTSSNKKAVTVDSKGNVSIVGAGTATIKVTASGTSTHTKAVRNITVTVNPKAVNITSVKSTKSKTLLVEWKKSNDCSGYQIQYSTSKTFSNAKNVTIKKSATTKQTVSSLKGNTKYYVRVRTYKTVDGKKYYSAWSSAKNTRVKK